MLLRHALGTFMATVILLARETNANFYWPLLLGQLKMQCPVTYQCVKPDEQYLFHIGHDDPPFTYVNTEGKALGIVLDIIKGVCEKADKNCDTVVLPWSACANTVDGRYVPGNYLMQGDVDVCAGWSITTERELSVTFTSKILETAGARFLFKDDTSVPTGFDPLKPADVKIAMVSGWSANTFCLTSHNVYIDNNVTFINFATVAGTVAAVKNGQADAAFTTYESSGLHSVMTDFSCGRGMAMKLKKANHKLNWWDDAFNKFVASGKYGELCDTYGTDVTCIPQL